MKGNKPKPLKLDHFLTQRLLRPTKPTKVFLQDVHSPVHSKDSIGANKSVVSLPRLEKSRGSLGDNVSPQSLSSRSLAAEQSKTLGSEERPLSSRRSVLSPRFMSNVLQRTNDAIKCSDSSIEVQEDETSLQKILAGRSQLDFSRTYHLADFELAQQSGMHLEAMAESSSRAVISFANVSRKRSVKRSKAKNASLSQSLRKAQSHIRELQLTSEDVRRRMEFHRERIKVLEEYCLNLNSRFKSEVDKMKKSLAQAQDGSSRQVLVKEASTSTEQLEENTKIVPRQQTSQCCSLM